MLKVLALGTYPIKNPIHGGQIRVKAIIKTLREYGIDARYISVYDDTVCKMRDVTKTDIPLRHDNRGYFDGVPLIVDLQSGYFAAHNLRIYRKILTYAESFHPDVFQVEQGWLYPVVKKLKKEKSFSGVKVIYSSHNNEAALKSKILELYPVENKNEVIEAITDLEKDLFYHSDLIFTVTKSDANYAKKYSKAPIIVVPNGISDSKIYTNKVNLWKKKIGENFILFIASGHPPNTQGFIELLSPLGFIPPDMKIVVVGAVKYGLLDYYQKESLYEKVDISRLILCGFVSNRDLSAIISLSKIIILPIVYGSGSNIKTAEAIYSGKYVIGTKKAFEGFKDFLTLNSIYCTNERAYFRKRLVELMEKPLPEKRDDEFEIRRRVLWDYTLKDMGRSIASLF